jgi:DHA1 family tetracycline resistance protein-like MFS transporter
MLAFTTAVLCFAAPTLAHRPPLRRSQPQQQNLVHTPRLSLSAAGSSDLMAAAPPPVERSDERPLQITAALYVLSLAVTALTAAPFMVEALGTAKATSTLAYIGSASAATEIIVAPILGAATDTLGRKLVLTGTLASVALVNGLVALHPSVPLLMVSKYISMMGTGLFFLSAGAILGDKYRKDPTKLAGASSLLFALVNGGFAVGIAVGSQLPGGLRTAFGVSAIGACLASLTCLLTVRESLPLEARVPFKPRAFNPLAFTRLLRHGRQLRLLVLLSALTLQPIFMGDFFQVYGVSQWGLDKKGLGVLFTLIPVLGAFANIVGGPLIARFGLIPFTLVATVSNLLYWVGCLFSFKMAIVGACIGALGAARTLAASTMIASAGAKAGMPQGELSGDRANLTAILKVIGPLLYGQLFVAGKAIGAPALPFAFNIALTTAALFLVPYALREPDAAGN